MGKSAPAPPPPIPAVVSQNAAGEVDSAILRRKSQKRGTNYEDTILGGQRSSNQNTNTNTVLGAQ